MIKKPNGETPVKCLCGRVVAVERDGKIYVICKTCKREIEVTKILKG